jgi:cell division protein FtsL
VAARRVRARGRTIVALTLLGFVLIAAGVIWRRAAGVERARELRALETRRSELEAQRAKLVSDIRDASSRGRLAAIAERRLDMHVPSDTQVVILPRTRSTPQ